MKQLHGLFIGMYPDKVNPYRNVFFKNLIQEMADQGVNCTVVSPVPITKYRTKIGLIPKKTVDYTAKGSPICVYYPRYVSLSSKKIGKFNTGLLSEGLFDCAVQRLVRKLKKPFDFVYGHFFLSGGLSAIKVGRKYSLPAFVAYGECNYKTEICDHFRELKQKDICGLSGIIAVSQNNKRVLSENEIFDNIPIVVAPNAVDMNLFYKRDKLQCRKAMGLPENQFIVGFVGGFVERKGDKRLLEAVNSIDGVYVAFAGRGDNPPSGDKVVFCKPLEHEDIPILLNAIDIFCLPTQNEGSCNAIVEAAACGVPIISSDLPFNDDLLNNENSIRINPDSIDEIRQAIITIYTDAKKRTELANNVWKDSQNFDIKNRTDKILSFINRFVQKQY